MSEALEALEVEEEALRRGDTRAKLRTDMEHPGTGSAQVRGSSKLRAEPAFAELLDDFEVADPTTGEGDLAHVIGHST